MNTVILKESINFLICDFKKFLSHLKNQKLLKIKLFKTNQSVSFSFLP